MEETAFAKINLALHVRAREPDGFHRIETIFAFCEDGDRLEVSDGDGLSLQVSGPFAATLTSGEDNLVLRAARALKERFAVTAGAALRLDKRLPVAAGLGGGSADAAAALRLLSRWWRLDAGEEDLLALAAPLGADVPACVGSRSARGEARGDRLAPWADERVAGAPVLLVNPGVPLSTAAVFRDWDGEDSGPLGALEASRNDLEPAATALVPEVADALEALEGARIARMSGSGATCFGLYFSEAERDAAAARIRAARPLWWQLSTRLR
ncbi:MAG TPA: 4-(cytidine 5'-diphospho)-2-C-methyl-D-erythritol kinase [Allosphingosinicella sp.]|nr:4-(cytidine 5'-diphospho)-2-C-methyl-D-erythritol kinase [Allosphingosinicella sp.]HYG30993.1 4-(cytidine 5'-diphospho)-2-C-methyl-D-erythritol kinase [Allosphingosinicella sp.]